MQTQFALSHQHTKQFCCPAHAHVQGCIAQVIIPLQPDEGDKPPVDPRHANSAARAKAAAERAERVRLIAANNARRTLPPEYADLNAAKLTPCSHPAGAFGVVFELWTNCVMLQVSDGLLGLSCVLQVVMLHMRVCVCTSS